MLVAETYSKMRSLNDIMIATISTSIITSNISSPSRLAIEDRFYIFNYPFLTSTANCSLDSESPESPESPPDHGAGPASIPPPVQQPWARRSAPENSIQCPILNDNGHPILFVITLPQSRSSRLATTKVLLAFPLLSEGSFIPKEPGKSQSQLTQRHTTTSHHVYHHDYEDFDC